MAYSKVNVWKRGSTAVCLFNTLSTFTLSKSYFKQRKRKKMIWLLVFFQGKVFFIQNVNSLKTEDDFHKNQGQMPIDMEVRLKVQIHWKTLEIKF